MKLIKVTLAIALVAATAACGASKSATPTPAASLADVKRMPIEWNYLHDVRSADSEMTTGFSDDALIKLGRQACKDLTSGTKLVDVVNQKNKLVIQQTGVNQAQAAAFVAAYVGKAIVNFCPEMAPK